MQTVSIIIHFYCDFVSSIGLGRFFGYYACLRGGGGGGGWITFPKTNHKETPQIFLFSFTFFFNVDGLAIKIRQEDIQKTYKVA